MRQHLGQHFLKCRWAISTIINAAELKKTDIVLEIGPGTGNLTRELAKNSHKVIAIEKDPRLALELKFSLKKEGITTAEIIQGDILKYAKAGFINLRFNKIVANIPYYLTSHLIRILLESVVKPELIVLTIQKEVAERIVAKPPQMNLLALSVQLFADAKLIKKIPRNCFSPPPEVESTVIKLKPRSSKSKLLMKKVFMLARRAFGQKRKMLRSSLGKTLTLPEKYQTKRPEDLSVEDWLKIATAHKSIAAADSRS